MKKSSRLESKLKKCDPQIQSYIQGLLSEISELGKYAGHLKGKNIFLDSQLKAMEAEMKEQAPPRIDDYNALKNLKGSDLAKELNKALRKVNTP